MANLVHRATSSMLSGPDWAMNMELCDLINSDPGLAKDAVKAVKKRMRHKNPKIQLLSLTILETMIKNCGDVVHAQVAARDVLPQMVKIAKKTKDPLVRDKILVLVDSWHEAFGGPNGRYPQYFIAHDELRRSGAMFPRRADGTNPIFTPPQTHPIASSSLSPQDSSPPRGDTSRASDLPVLSLSDMHNARSGMEVLAEMLNAIDPQNRQALKDEVIVELVEQCRTAERRVMHLVNSTSDEELLRHGLSLNDDLKKVLAKFDAFSSGVAPPKESPASDLIPMDKQDKNGVLPQQLSGKTSASTSSPLPGVAAPQQQNKGAPPATTRAPSIDLLSGESFEGAIVPVPQPTEQKPSELSLISLDFEPSVSNNGTNLQSQTYSQNGTPPGQFGMPAQNIYGNAQQANLAATQSPPMNSYVVPWAQPQKPLESTTGMYNQGLHGNLDQVAVNQNGTTLSMQASSINQNGSTLNAQQAALIYGTQQIPQAAASSQQDNSIFGSVLGSQPGFPVGTQANRTGPEMSYGQATNMTQHLGHLPNMTSPGSAQMQQSYAQTSNSVQYAQQQSPPLQPQKNSVSSPVQSGLPPAPWESALDSNAYGNSVSPQSSQTFQIPSVQPQNLVLPQSSLQAYQNSSLQQQNLPIPQSPLQAYQTASLQQQNFGLSQSTYQSYQSSSLQPQLVQPQHSLQTFQQNQMYPNAFQQNQMYPTASYMQGQYAQAVHPGLVGQMQNLTLQGQNNYYAAMQATAMQTTGSYMHGSDLMTQKPSYPRKETKAEDGLFKDLVNYAKTKK